MTNLAIRGHKTRGKEVIEILEMLGGINTGGYLGHDIRWIYIINSDGEIDWDYPSTCNYFTLKEFLEKFTYKLNELVLCDDGLLGIITKIEWDCEKSDMKYHISFNTHIYNKWYNSKNIKCKLAKKDMINLAIKGHEARDKDVIKISIPKGYEFTGVDNQQVVLEKIEYQYPKNFKECCEVLSLGENGKLYTKGYKASLIQDFHKLIICRNAYWKIAGEQMSLGKPWSPSKSTSVYCIFRYKGDIVKDNFVFGDSLILEFPTEEMRDAFFENFGHLIELCKELL